MKRIGQLKNIIAVFLFSFFLNNIFADDAPVVDITQNDAVSANNNANVSSKSSKNDNSDSASAQTFSADSQATANTFQPVVSAAAPQSVSQPAAVAPDTSIAGLSKDQRLARLESQMNNLVQMNLSQQIDELRQNLQALQGQLQDEQHELKILTDQQHNFYQDLDQRIARLNKQLPNGQTTAVAQTSATKQKNVTAKINDSSDYQSALNLLTTKKYADAINAFQAYIKNYPNGQFLVNAHYWLGEIYFNQKNYPQSATEFNVVITQFSASNKVSDANLKLATIHINTGHSSQGRQELQQIKTQYPGTTAAQLASIQLQQLNIANHAAN